VRLLLTLHQGAVRLLLAFHLSPVEFHLGLVDFLGQLQLAGRALGSRSHFDAKPLRGFGGPAVGLALNAQRLPDDHHDDAEHHGPEEPVRLRPHLTGAENNEPRDGEPARGAARQPPDATPAVDRSEPTAVTARRDVTGCRLGGIAHVAAF
jgi:hypothetical protein